MIPRPGQQRPPNEMQVFLETVELPITAENVEAKSPAKVSEQQVAAASTVKKQPASAPEVIARQDDSPEEAEQPVPATDPRKGWNASSAKERPVPAPPPRLERSKLDPESKPEQAEYRPRRSLRPDPNHRAEADVDRPPRPVHNPAPEYPPAALKARQTGRVVLRVRVGADSWVLAAEGSFRQRSDRSLDAAALQAVRGWRFESALQAGSPVEQEIAVPVNFVIAEPKK